MTMTDTLINPKVCIDGNAIKRIREANKLTQLYVAKVVGVTTDTVSRWENNRYPSIRRDNALLLAEALEVDPAQILLNGTGEPDGVEGQVEKRRLGKTLPVLVVVLLIILAAIYYIQQKQPLDYEFSANRVLPSHAVPDGILPVRIRLHSSGDLKGVILREHFPKGWTLLQASPPPSSLDNVEGTVRWILKPDERPAVISYLLQVPAGLEADRIFSFEGEASVNPRGSGETLALTGADRLKIGLFHWADDNGDGVIDDGETLAAANSVDEMEELHLDWEVIEKIWDAGHYRWDATLKKFIPVRPPPAQ